MKRKDAFRMLKVSFSLNNIIIYLIFSVLFSISEKTYSVLPVNELSVSKTNYVFQGIPKQRSADPKAASLQLRKLLNDAGLNDAGLNDAGIIADVVRSYIKQNLYPDSSDRAYAYYLIGSYDLTTRDYNEAINNLKKSVSLCAKSGRGADTTYSNALYNLGCAFSGIGDSGRSLRYFEASLAEEKLIKGDSSLRLISIYIALSSTNYVLRDYEKMLEWINLGLDIVQKKPDSVNASTMGVLYVNKGVAFTCMADYGQARGALEKAETYYGKGTRGDLNYINLLDNLGTAYHFLGSKEKSYFYYEKGVKFLANDISQMAFNLICNYAIILANDSLAGKGDLLLADFMRRVEIKPTTDLRFYYNIRRNYADYLNDNKLNYGLAKELYLQCFNYLATHSWDNDLRDNTILGYSSLLLKNGQNRIALDSIRKLLFPGKETSKDRNPFINPDSLKAEVRSVKILGLKYRILWTEYKSKNDVTVLEAAAETSERIIDILERIRLSIGEEGSRLLLGDKYRNSYMNAIMCLNECYGKTKDQQYLEKTFKYSEKSKVASLLASKREMRAIQNFIPPALGNMEKELQQNVRLYSSALADQENVESRDSVKIRILLDSITIFSERKDSMVRVFEKTYPGYYSVKYNSSVIGLNELPGIIGNRKNYLSYIVSDSLLYTFISNKQYRQLIVQRIDNSFFETVTSFRKILTTPDKDEKSSDEFRLFQYYGFKLYSLLIGPVRKYFVSNDIIISPDYILSYLPFESFLTSETHRNDLMYTKLPYLTNDYNISYTYSATLLAENKKTGKSMLNKTIVFSPAYNTEINLDSINNERQAGDNILRDLPNAKEEAAFVARKTHGLLFSDTAATELNYKKMAGSFDIIHLAMHTYINMQDPFRSRLCFSGPGRSGDGKGMSAFEVYGTALNAKMVVLSSCNTGVGNLRRSEGVLSLARGFIYSGSKSVVMSLWEVDDKSGTDIVKSFYRYLKMGYSKSEALRKARMRYLKKAGTVWSFPHYWSTLVIYGDDSPVYFGSRRILIAAASVLVLLLTAFIYFRKR